MPSSSNCRMTPYVIMNDHSEQLSVSYSTRQSISKESNGIQTLVDTSIRNPHIITRSFHRFTRAIQV
jgi:hypothetical protein